MKYEVEIDGQRRGVEITSDTNGQLRAKVDGRAVECEVLQPEPNTYLFILGQQVFEIHALNDGADQFNLQIAGTTVLVRVLDPKHRPRSAEHGLEGRQQILSPMPGKVVRVLVEPGAAVESGQGVIIVEAMKMQNELKSPKTGSVVEITVTEGQAVNASQVLMVIE